MANAEENPIKPYFPLCDREFWTAIKNVPDADIRCFDKIFEKFPEFERMPEEQIRINLIMNRYTNPICDHCSKKPPKVKLYRCPECQIAMYCGDACLKAARPAHVHRCCRKDGPLDGGPQKIVFIIPK